MLFLVLGAKNRATPLITTGLLSVGLLRELCVRWQCVSVRGAERSVVTLPKCVL